MSNLSELLPTGGGQNAGVTVALKADGTVEAVAETSVTESIGSAVSINTGTFNYINSTFDTANDKVLIVYTGASNYGYCIVGTVSGASISFGTPVVYSSATTYYQDITFDTNAGKCVVFYSDYSAGEYGFAKVGTVSGTSISFGSASYFNSSGGTIYTSCTYDSSEQRVVVAFRDSIESNKGKIVSGVISGTSISFIGESTFNTGITAFIGVSYDPAQDKTLIFYQDNSNSRYPTCRVANLSGTSWSYGTETVVESRATEHHGIVSIGNSKHVIAYRNDGSPNNLVQARVATVSGTSVTFGSEANTGLYLNNSPNLPIAYDDRSNSIVIVGRNVSATYRPIYIIGSVTNDAITFGSASVLEDVTSYQGAVGYDSVNKKIIPIWGFESSNGSAAVLTAPYTATNSASFIGITSKAISDTATGAVNVYGGINEAQTGLTIGSDYYVQDDGSLSTTASSVKVGQAISATTINMMDLT
jgi:hypothetical protein